jgi:ABC-type nitrate/sulfonate/bicarbonate transport system substrate-binding protein
MLKRFNWMSLLVVLSAFAVSSRADSRTINLAIPCLCAQYLPFLAARDKGYYKDEGLEMQVILMPGGGGIRALIGGNVEFAALGEFLAATTSGAPFRIIFTSYYRALLWLYSQPEIRTVKDLKGKKVAVSGIGSATDFALREALKKRGMEGGRDIAVMALGAPGVRYTALKTGNMDAAILSEHHKFIADEDGFRELISFLKEDLVLLSGSVGVREILLASDGPMIEKFIRASIKGLLYVRENRSGTIPYMARTFKIEEGFAARVYDVSVPGFTKGFVNEAMQKEAYAAAVDRLKIKDPPSRERIFNYALTEKVLSQLESKGWKPEP